MAKSKSKDKKPTMNEVKNVINNLIREMDKMQRAIMQLDSLIYGYVDFKQDTEEYKEYLKQKAKEAASEREADGSDAETNTVSDKKA